MPLAGEDRRAFSGELADEAHAPARVGDAVAHAAPSAAEAVERHLTDQERAIAIDRLDVRDVAQAARALHPRLEDDRAAGRRVAVNPEATGAGRVVPVGGVAQPDQARGAAPGVPGAFTGDIRARARADPVGAARGAGAGADAATGAAAGGGSAHNTAGAGHPGGVIRDEPAAATVPALRAVEGAVRPAIAEPTALHRIAARVAQTRAGGVRRGGAAELRCH